MVDRVHMPLGQDQSDLQAARNGDAEAYRRIVLRHQEAIFGRMRRFARGRTDIEELAQETFVEAWLSLHTFRGTAPFEHWLNRIATRVGFRFWKNSKSDRSQSTDSVDLKSLAARADGDASAAAELLERVMGRLSVRDRLVLTLLHLEERSIAQTAELTGWSQTMVKVQAFRARGKLRKLLEEIGIDETMI